MFGNGVGSLTVSISDTREVKERDIWSLTGEAGNAWYQAEVPVSSSNPFKVNICIPLLSRKNFSILISCLCADCTYRKNRKK